MEGYSTKMIERKIKVVYGDEYYLLLDENEYALDESGSICYLEFDEERKAKYIEIDFSCLPQYFISITEEKVYLYELNKIDYLRKILKFNMVYEMNLNSANRIIGNILNKECTDFKHESEVEEVFIVFLSEYANDLLI